MPRHRRRDLLEVRNLGPIRDVSLELGDLTLLVGAQGTGKSIALQLLKLAHDSQFIAKMARDNSLTWSTTEDFLDAYLGTGLGTSWGESSTIAWRGKPIALPPRQYASPREPKVFYVPAQRRRRGDRGVGRAHRDQRALPRAAHAGAGEDGIRMKKECQELCTYFGPVAAAEIPVHQWWWIPSGKNALRSTGVRHRQLVKAAIRVARGVLDQAQVDAADSTARSRSRR